MIDRNKRLAKLKAMHADCHELVDERKEGCHWCWALDELEAALEREAELQHDVARALSNHAKDLEL